MAYLDGNGLGYFWDKIKTFVGSKIVNSMSSTDDTTNAPSINAVKDYIGNLKKWETTEQKIGTIEMADNTIKNRYRKVIYYKPASTIGNAAGTSLIDIAHGISNLDKVVDVSAVTTSSASSNDRYPLPYIYWNFGTSKIETTSIEKVTNSNIQLRIANTTWTNSNTFIFTIEYTKTTN